MPNSRMQRRPSTGNNPARPRVLAHRGGAGLRVENTLAAFAHAMDCGADGSELDVRLTADGEVVVHHDSRLNPAYCRRPDGNYIRDDERSAISSLSYQELSRYEIGIPDPHSDYAARFNRIVPVAGQRVPSLRDVIRIVRDRSDSFILVVEIKSSVLDAAKRPWKQLVDRTLEVVESEGFPGRIVLCSFDWGSLVYAMRQRPGLPTWFTTHPLSWLGDGVPPASDIPPDPAYLAELRKLYHRGAPWYGGFDPRDFDGGYPEAIAAAGGCAWFMYYTDFSPARKQALDSHRLGSAAWSVDLRDTAVLQQLAGSGLCAICMDYPDMTLGQFPPDPDI